MLLIGSRAEKFWHPEIDVKENADWDVIAYIEELEFLGRNLNPDAKTWRIGPYEFHNARFLNNQVFEVLYGTRQTVFGPELGITRIQVSFSVCSSKGLAILKRSHMHRKGKFAKNIRHYQYLDKDFDEDDLGVLRDRTRMTKEVFGDKTPNMELTVDEFFDDYVTKHINHDLVHTVVGYYDTPLYKTCQRDPTIVRIEEDLWDQLSHEDKVKMVREEAYVISLERWVIPEYNKGREYPVRFAFDKALERICTNLCGGFFRDFAIDNWYEISQFTQQNYDNFFNSNIWHEYTTKRTD